MYKKGINKTKTAPKLGPEVLPVPPMAAALVTASSSDPLPTAFRHVKCASDVDDPFRGRNSVRIRLDAKALRHVELISALPYGMSALKSGPIGLMKGEYVNCAYR
jgi:hypothetical protein